MKKILILVLGMFLLFSCGNDNSIITEKEKKQINKIKENRNQLIGITKEEIEEKIKKTKCFTLKLVDIKDNDYIFEDGGLLDGFKISYFDKKYILKKLEWNATCTDMPTKQDKIVFFNKKEDKYYLLENNDLENFLENGNKFFIKNNIDESDKNLILRKGINNKKGKIIILRELDENKGRIFSPATFEHIGKLEKRWIKYDYKNKKEGTTLFVGFIKNITKEAKGVCKGDNKGKIEKSIINIYILEVSDEFEIVNIEKTYGEKNVENKKYCYYYG